MKTEQECRHSAKVFLSLKWKMKSLKYVCYYQQMNFMQNLAEKRTIPPPQAHSQFTICAFLETRV